MNYRNIRRFTTSKEIERGRGNEKLFKSILSDRSKNPWIERVEESSRSDDLYRGIDFYVYTTTGWRIPVDVKSSAIGLMKHVEKHGSWKVCVVVMDDALNDDDMRKEALDRLARWQEEAIKHGDTTAKIR